MDISGKQRNILVLCYAVMTLNSQGIVLLIPSPEIVLVVSDMNFKIIARSIISKNMTHSPFIQINYL